MIRILLACFIVLTTTTAKAETLRLAVTTSFNNSGLSDVLLPVVKQDTGLDVQLLIVGTGQAIRLGAAGDVDAILVHSQAAEEAFVAAGNGTHRRKIMYNDFVLVGPSGDPAGITVALSAADVMNRLAETKHGFVSRGDDSGTHKKEVSLWSSAQRDPSQFGPWYKSVGAGMGASLNIASGLNAYIMSDRASWLNFANKGELSLLFSGDPALFNQYTYIQISPAKHPHVNAKGSAQLEAWLVSETASELINGYKVAGEVLFTFNAETK